MGIIDAAISVADLTARTTVVSVHGELDLSGGEKFRAALASRNGDGNAGRRLIVDLAGTTFIDSTGLGAIAAAAKRARRTGEEVNVVANDPRIVRVFQLTGLDRSISVVRSLDEAIARAMSAPAVA